MLFGEPNAELIAPCILPAAREALLLERLDSLVLRRLLKFALPGVSESFETVDI